MNKETNTKAPEQVTEPVTATPNQMEAKGKFSVRWPFIAIVAVLAAALGGLIYYQQRQAQKTYDAAGGAIVAKHAKKMACPSGAAAPSVVGHCTAGIVEVDPTDDWTSFSSTQGKFSLKYPSTWVQPSNKSLCSPGIFDRTLYLGPSTATVLHCASSYFGMIAVGSVVGDKRSDYNLGTDYEDVDIASVKADTVTGKRISGTLKTSSDDPDAMPVGTKTINYVFYTGGVTYFATYSQRPSNPDVSDDFDLMIKETLKFSS